MASSTARARAPARTRRPARRQGMGTQAIALRGIRWDRVARLSLLIALGLVLLLYVKPAARYFEAWQLSRDTHTELKELRTDNAQLREIEGITGAIAALGAKRGVAQVERLSRVEEQADARRRCASTARLRGASPDALKAQRDDPAHRRAGSP